MPRREVREGGARRGEGRRRRAEDPRGGEAPLIRPRASAGGRPCTDPGCAGCPQLGTFRALRRAGLPVEGGLTCDPDAGDAPPAAGGPFAVVAGVDDALRRGPSLLGGAGGGDRPRLVVVAGPPGPRAARLAAALAGAGASVFEVDPSRPRDAEEAVARAAATPAAAVLALAPCTRGRVQGVPVAISERRCNRCGACLSLACPAISDPGGEALAIDPTVCTGCGLCAPLCRAGAIAPAS